MGVENCGTSSLHVASCFGSVECVGLMLNQGTNGDLVNIVLIFISVE